MTMTVDIVVVYERQEYYVSTQTSLDRKTLFLDLLQCQLFSLMGVMPNEQILVSSRTGEVLCALSKSNVETVALSSTESRPRFFLFSSTNTTSTLPELANDWRQICTKATFGDAAMVQPAFRKIASDGDDPLVNLICGPCARTCTTGFRPVSPMEWNASQMMTSQFISDITVIAGDVDVAPPPGYTKLPVDLNYSASGDYIYLCVKRGGSRALTQIYIRLDPAGAENVPCNVDSVISYKPEKTVKVCSNNGTTGSDGSDTEICIGYDSVQLNMEQLETLAITDIAIVVGDQSVALSEYVKLSRNLNDRATGSLPVYLYYRLVPLGGFACNSGREHSEFGQCLFATRHLIRVKSGLDLEERRLTIAHTTLAAERRRADVNIMEEHYRQHQPGMLKRLQSGLQRAQSYENKTMQEEALKRIPVDKLHERARSNVSPMPLLQDELIKQLLHWFKCEFFTWMDQPHCSVCTYEKARLVRTEGPTTAEEIAGQASRVEVYQCPVCEAFARFPRYNDPVKLLETRTGRCGEWANCFTLCCRAMGFEARYVLDVTDHVWTEVYSEHFKRWLHCDPCEGQLDCPLTYEVGWGKKLSYIFSFGHDEVVDTAKRYTRNWSEMLARRQDVSEKWLETIINQINHGLWEQQNPERVAILSARATAERDELYSRRYVRNSEVKGRVSGSGEWKSHRNETGKQDEVPVSTSVVSSSAITSTFVPIAEVLQDICRNLVVGCQFLECYNPFCCTGRMRLDHTAVQSEVSERAVEAIQVASTLSSTGFSSQSLVILLCPLTSTDLRNFLWKNRPVLYLPLQDVPSTCSDRSVPLLDISGHNNHGDNSQRCGLRKPFKIPNSGPTNDYNDGAGSQRKNGTFGMQLLGGKVLSIISGKSLPPENIVLSFLVRFDLNNALTDKTKDTVSVLAGRIGSSNLLSLVRFGIYWSKLERQFLGELQIENENPETITCTTSLLAFGQYAHVAIEQGKNAVEMYINGTKILVLNGECQLNKSDIIIQGPGSDSPSVAAVISHVALIPAQSSEWTKMFCAGMKTFISATPLKAFGCNGERVGERCYDVIAEAQSGYRVARILMWGNDFFDGLQFAYDKLDNANSAPATVLGSLVGNAHAKRQASQPTVSFGLLPNEIVARMSGRKGAWIDGITLHTNLGRSITCGGKGGDDFEVSTPADSEIRFIAFTIGDHLNDANVFVFQTTSMTCSGFPV
ncbi:unnamed protein product [Peronospora belbahrii]|uniref:MABP domain-containing protein n=1 Tax=Peronospora belbahrii TaxID=622444 RepID=A0ABN8D1B7_9STRA|nr:unnamed protein product [Peronospora belbahrii]